jgi:hypothetical protein
MVFAVLHSANTECTAAWLLKPDADIILTDRLAARPQVATVICRFRIFKHFALGTCADRNLVTDWTWTACTPA